MPKTPLVAGNWKMHKTIAEAEAFTTGLRRQLESPADVDVAVCPPFLALRATVEAARGSAIAVYAQNTHEADSGAFTGEVAAPMLREVGVDGVLLGHSERRALFGEDDAGLKRKVVKALDSGLRPMLCVGESEAERESGATERKLRHQVTEALERIDRRQLAGISIAYEPIWAIGTGRVATAATAQEACAFVRALVTHLDAGAAEEVRILYGGSVRPDNAAELMRERDIDGFLVGGASLEVDSFLAIIAAVRQVRAG